MIAVGEASNRICGKRLQLLPALVVEAVERHGRVQL